MGKKLQKEILNLQIHPNLIKNEENRLFKTQRGVFSSQSIQNCLDSYTVGKYQNASSQW